MSTSDPVDRHVGENLSERSFTGYRRQSGMVGVRNRVIVLPSVICSHIVAERITDSIEGAVSTPHDHGCAQIGADHDQTERTLLNITLNPNVAGATVVGLGCEHLQSGPFAEKIASHDVPVRETAIQTAGGTDPCIEEGIELTNTLTKNAGATDEESACMSDLTVGIVSSDISDSTRTVADPLVGTVVNRLIQADAHVIAAGIERLAGHSDAVQDRAADSSVRRDIQTMVDRFKMQPGSTRSIAEDSIKYPLEEITATWGNQPVAEVIDYGDRTVRDSGLTLLDSPSRFEEAATGLAAAGASIIIHVTAEGIPTGHPIVPVIKITGEDSTASVLTDDIDIDARSSAPADLIATLRSVADGASTATERHGLTKFAINRVGPSM
ncbi:MAG: Altronate dehydratase [Haloquadratum sp. J07HQX50]|nr:MAG: Altronate dehydratase [Haloquadratum sp. J07HQX50]